MGELKTAGAEAGALRNGLYSMLIIVFFVALTLAELASSAYWYITALGAGAIGSVIFGVAIGRRSGFVRGILWTLLGLGAQLVFFLVLGLVWLWNHAPEV